MSYFHFQIGCSLSVGFFAAPLVSLSHVIRTRSTDVLPFAMILSNFLAGALWSIYGILIDDNFVKIPNFLGFAISSFQLMLYAYFPSPLQTSSVTQHNLDPRIKRKETSLNID
jgi:solute carrier family 50 protein (sugar transporter)